MKLGMTYKACRDATPPTRRKPLVTLSSAHVCLRGRRWIKTISFILFLDAAAAAAAAEKVARREKMQLQPAAEPCAMHKILGRGPSNFQWKSRGKFIADVAQTFLTAASN